MPNLILPNGQSHRSTKRGSDFITVDDMVSLYGPLASLVKQIAIKLNMDTEETSDAEPVVSLSGDLE